MSRISRQEVDQIAQLARLSLSDSEALAMQRDLERILQYVATLETLDTAGVAPTAQSEGSATPVRPDESVEPMDPDLAVANAPEVAGTAFVVPRVIDEEGS
jgi:aspartyl-tRNA(Asn)/glutamyl-tRNA(Gln) amidotransferase subunit C